MRNENYGGPMALTALRLRSGVQIVVALHTVEELLPALRVPDVLNPEVDTLLDVTVADNLVDDDSDSAGGNVVDDASPPEGIGKTGHVTKQALTPCETCTHPW